MSESFFGPELGTFGTPEMQLPPELLEPIRRHLETMREQCLNMGWAQRCGFGERPALLVIDLALFWTQPGTQMGSHVDSIVEATCRLLEAARQADCPIFFSSFDYDPAARPGIKPGKSIMPPDLDPGLFELDPRLARRPSEKLLRKSYASCFHGTNLRQMLDSLGVDTLIVTGVSTSHCVYASCRDAISSYRVIVPREAVGERCQILHMVNLLDIDIDVGDVMPTEDVITYLGKKG